MGRTAKVISTPQAMQSLVAAVLSGSASETDQARLCALVTGSEDGRRLYVETVCDELNLSAVLREQSLLPDDELPLPASRLGNFVAEAYYFIVHPTALSMLVSALFVTSFVLSLALVTLPEINRQPAVAPSRSDYVARIYDMQGAEWKVDEGVAPQLGDDLMTGQQLALAAGYVRLLYDSGTTVLLEGPAEYTISGENAGSLQRGSLVARVSPEAVGFVLDTRRATIVDLGTEFGTFVDEAENVAVEVFEGSVRLEAGDQAQVVQAGGSLRVTSGGIEPGSGPNRFARRLPREKPGAYSQAVLAAGPLAYYRLASIASESGDRLRANGVRIGQVQPSPQLNAAGGFPGFESFNRWANFSGAGDSTLTELQAGWTSQAGTIMYWVRMDEEAGHSTQAHLFASKGSQGTFGIDTRNDCIASYMRRDGSFGVVIDRVHLDVEVEPALAVHQWNHLTITWQQGDEEESGEVAIYLNGDLVKAGDGLQWGTFSVANVRFGKEISGASRVMGGSVDEIAIFSRALSPQQIKQLYAAAVQLPEEPSQNSN